MKRIIAYFLVITALFMLNACGNSISIDGTLDEEPSIFPDYKEVTIPVNIAPLNFVLTDSTAGSTRLLIEGKTDQLVVKGKDGDFERPEKAWKKLLEAEVGGDITFTVCTKKDGRWLSMKPFKVHIVADKADKYIAYRLIAPGYIVWKKMGIYQRNVEDFTQTPIFENSLTEYNCVNCHTFQARNPEKMIFHARVRNAGMVYVDNEQIKKLNTKTDQTTSPLVYGYWHPTADYVAFSVNQTRLANFLNAANCMEVYDSESDVVLFNVKTNEVFTCPQLSSEAAFETFPTFSPDGRSLYFCTADSVSPMPDRYLDTHYSLCRIDFNPEDGTFGETVDTLYNARTTKMSVSFPRISPDGKYLAFTLHQYGNFSIWQRDADIYMVDMADNRIYPLDEINTDQTESYHSWSSNNRWMVFSSRRVDGLYTRLFFTYIDEQGKAHKPFMLPQRHPKKFYEELLYSYNLPEFLEGKVKFNRQDIARFMRDTEAERVSFKEN